jgi:hypothetical protein
MYGCETSLKLRGKQEVCVFQNRILREISGPPAEEIRGVWRKPAYSEVS